MQELPQPEALARECAALIRAEVAALLTTVRGGGDDAVDRKAGPAYTLRLR